MDAGKQLDAEVAERVMHLRPGVDFGTWPEHDWIRDAEGEIDTHACETDEVHGPRCRRCSYAYPVGWAHETGPCEVAPPYYSRSIEAAWEVVEALRSRYGQVRLESYPWGWQLEGPGFVGEGHTMPLAICLAALRAVGTSQRA